MCLYPKVYTQSNININDINGHIHSDEGTFIPNGTTSDRKDFFAHHYNSKDFMLKFISEKHVKKDVNAFFVVDISEIYNKVFLWFEKLPRVKPYYAVKCNSDSFILKTMISLGCGFDCASKNEIKKVLELGVKPENIIYANPCKQDSYIRYAREVNVKIITFDNAHELIKISRLFPDADLVIRILTNDEHSLCQLGSKFGTPPSALSPLFKLAKQLKLRIIGVSFHVGSGCFSAKAFGDAISRARLVFDLAEKLSMPLRVLDLGGGFPGIDEVITFSQVALVINRALNKYFPFVKFKDLSVIAEPGRFFVTTSHSLAVNVIAKRTCLYPVQRRVSDSLEVDSLELDNEDSHVQTLEKTKLAPPSYGVYGSFNCIIFDHASVKAVPLCNQYGSEFPEHSELRSCSIWGPTCDAMDCILKDALLPEMEVGDWILFPNMGAYTTAAASTFNGMEAPDVVYVDSRFAVEYA